MFPTNIAQKSASVPSGTGHRIVNSFHQRRREMSESGWVASNTKIAASAPRKNAVERAEKRSCPAVSYTKLVSVASQVTKVKVTAHPYLQ